jgi:site-specific DNA-methyltransferase (adenine-specific)
MASISDLRSDHKNARKRTDRSATLIEESLKRYGAARSVVIDEDNRILAGNGTVDAAKRAGISKVRVIETDGDEIIAVKRTGLTEDQKIGLALADNRTSDLSEWDKEMLHQLSEEHDITPWFEAEDLAEIMGEVEVIPPEGLTDADDVPEAPEDPTTKPGDLWILGHHRLLCGDSTSMDEVERLMGGTQADLLLTDPPYNVALGRDETPEEAKKRNRRTDGLTIQNDSMSDDDFRQFLRDVYSAADAVMKPGAAFYIWYAEPDANCAFRLAANDVGWKIRQCLVWNKNSLVMGRQDYHWKHEPCLYGWKEGAAHFWGSDRSQTTVLDFNKPSRNGEHPTMKPVELFQYQLENSSKKNGVVLDLFGGSGSTLIACEKTGRQARLMELDPRYCDVIVKRWEDFTGKKAILEESQEAY